MPRPESESKLSEEETRIPHLTEAPAQPREPGLAGRIAEVKKFKGPPGIRQGLCPSCLGSGYAHAERNGLLGVLYRTVRVDQWGRNVDRLVRCSCPLGASKTSGEQEVKQLIESVDDED